MPPKSLLIAALRRLWLMSKPRQEALRAGRVSRGRYRCADCQAVFPRKAVQVDHIDEIGTWTSWDVYIDRLFCDVSNLQLLCVPCHKAKTNRRSRASLDRRS